MRELDLNEIQAYLKEMLASFDLFCSLNNLEYRLNAGTLLGAIRHKGFIPWDDDVDVYMPRPHYMKLAEISHENEKLPSLPNYYHFVDYTSGYPKAIIRMCDKRIRVVENDNDPNVCIAELFLDIFPVDGMPDEINSIKRVYRKTAFITHIENVKTTKISASTALYKKIARLIARPVVCRLKDDYLPRRKEKILLANPYENAKYVGAASSGSCSINEVMLRKDFESCQWVEFEGLNLKAFRNWDQYLRNVYGDYMELPPIESRCGHCLSAQIIEE